MTKLKNLEEFNAEKYAAHRATAATEARQNGIACPECGAELWDTYPPVVRVTEPLKTRIHCQECDYWGYRAIT